MGSFTFFAIITSMTRRIFNAVGLTASRTALLHLTLVCVPFRFGIQPLGLEISKSIPWNLVGSADSLFATEDACSDVELFLVRDFGAFSPFGGRNLQVSKTQNSGNDSQNSKNLLPYKSNLFKSLHCGFKVSFVIYAFYPEATRFCQKIPQMELL